MTFRKVTKLKTQVIGSIQSDTGSEYLFGFDPEDGLLWLERSGVEYGPADKSWHEADRFIRSSLQGEVIREMEPVEVNRESVPLGTRPGTVSRSVASDFNMGVPQRVVAPNDPRIVGSVGVGAEYDDDEIAANAALMYGDMED